ncbi:MAG: hypothetical protein M1609_15465 [Firmicutes bacterium]|nr:hypothetical protein [Bacillota bacterium]
MFFETAWQGIVFGVVTTVGMLAFAYALASMWKKYEDVKEEKGHGCDAHSHH